MLTDDPAPGEVVWPAMQVDRTASSSARMNSNFPGKSVGMVNGWDLLLASSKGDELGRLGRYDVMLIHFSELALQMFTIGTDNQRRLGTSITFGTFLVSTPTNMLYET